MRIFDNLLDSYKSRNWTEFEELCESTLTMDVESFCKLQDLLDGYPDLDDAYSLAFKNHPEWGDPETFYDESIVNQELSAFDEEGQADNSFYFVPKDLEEDLPF
jgi:hypothetical protein